MYRFAPQTTDAYPNAAVQEIDVRRGEHNSLLSFTAPEFTAGS